MGAEGSQGCQVPEAEDFESAGEERAQHRDACGLAGGGFADGPALAAVEAARRSCLETQLQVHRYFLFCPPSPPSNTIPPGEPTKFTLITALKLA